MVRGAENLSRIKLFAEIGDFIFRITNYRLVGERPECGEAEL